MAGASTSNAKISRNSTDPEDFFYAPIDGTDVFARALIAANTILQKSGYKKTREERYASFDNGKEKKFEEGKLSLEDFSAYAIENGEPEVISGRQEYLENMINRYIIIL